SGAACLCVGSVVGVPCLSTGLRYGAWAESCPVGDPLLELQVTASDLLRGGEGELMVSPVLLYMDRDNPRGDPRGVAMRRGYSIDVQFLTADEQPVAGVEVGSWRRRGD